MSWDQSINIFQENSEDGHDDENRRNARTAESVVIENLNRWKFSTEQRMERLERLLESSSGAATSKSFLILCISIELGQKGQLRETAK